MRWGRRTEQEKQAADKKKRRRKTTMMSALLTLQMLTCGRVSDGEHLTSPVCTEKKRHQHQQCTIWENTTYVVISARK